MSHCNSSLHHPLISFLSVHIRFLYRLICTLWEIWFLSLSIITIWIIHIVACVGFIPSKCCLLFHSINTPQFVCPFVSLPRCCTLVFGFLQVFDFLNKVTLNLHRNMLPHLLHEQNGWIICKYMLTFQETGKPFSKLAVPFYISHSGVLEFWFFHNGGFSKN